MTTLIQKGPAIGQRAMVYYDHNNHVGIVKAYDQATITVEIGVATPKFARHNVYLIPFEFEINPNPDEELKMANQEKMIEVLLWLDAKGGLGFDAHERIKSALGVPYPKFCSQAAQCLQLGRCARNPVCNN